jgi:HEAT repeat protein
MNVRMKTTLIAATLAGAMLVTGCEQADWTNPEYVNKQLLEGDPATRKIAFQNIGELGDEKRAKLVPGLIKVYEDAGANQKDAMQLLVQMRTPEAKDVYLAELKSDATGYAGAAAGALGEIDARDSIPAMLEVLNSTDKADVKVSIVTAFSYMPDKSLVGPLVKVLELDVDNNPIAMHSFACDVLKKIAFDDPSAIDDAATKQITLAMFYANQTNQTLDKDCGKTVQALGDKAVPHLLAAFKQERDDITTLLMKYDTPDAPFPANHAKLIATQRLASMRADEAVEPIMADLNSTKEAPKTVAGMKAVNWRMREGQVTSEELYALGDIAKDGRQILEDVVAGKKVNEEWDDITDGLVELQLRQDAAFSLVRYGDREALPTLLEAAEKAVVNDLEKRAAMLEANKQPIKDLERYQINWMMAHAYADLATADKKPDFVKLVETYKKDYPEVGKKMEEFLVKFDVAAECSTKGDAKAQGTCYAGKLSDPNKLVREKAAWEIVRLPADVAGPILVENLGIENLDTREILTFGLYRAPSKEATAKIEKILEDEANKGQSHALDHYRLELAHAWLKGTQS